MSWTFIVGSVLVRYFWWVPFVLLAKAFPGCSLCHNAGCKGDHN